MTTWDMGKMLSVLVLNFLMANFPLHVVDINGERVLANARLKINSLRFITAYLVYTTDVKDNEDFFGITMIITAAAIVFQ